MRPRCQHLIGDPIRFLFVDIPRLVNLEFGLQTKSVLFPTLAAFAPRHRVIGAGTSALELRLRHANHLFGDVIRFPLVPVL
jgi:hypothetical protein